MGIVDMLAVIERGLDTVAVRFTLDSRFPKLTSTTPPCQAKNPQNSRKIVPRVPAKEAERNKGPFTPS